jgi:hypothetical protein
MVERLLSVDFRVYLIYRQNSAAMVFDRTFECDNVLRLLDERV